MASHAPIKSSLPLELSLLLELGMLTASAGSRTGLGRLCSVLLGGGAQAQWLLAFTIIGSTADTMVPENAPIS